MIRSLYVILLGIAHTGATPLNATPAPMNGDSAILLRVARLQGSLSPKSIAWNGHGLFFAQNMMYRHTVEVFDDRMQHCGTIKDRVMLADIGICDRSGSYRGAPVECTFTRDGRYAYVSNYQMEGEGFANPGCDACTDTDLDGSYVYRINTSTLKVDAAYPTGSVPKFLTLTPDERVLVVANWSSGDVSLIDLEDEGCSERIAVGRFPRGLAVDPEGGYAYVAIMGGNAIKRIDLHTRVVEHFATVGTGPRHLCMDREGKTLYASLNHEGAIAKIDIETRTVGKLHVGSTPRSMTFGQEERSLYVVNYGIDRVTKVDLNTFSIAGTATTDAKPIGITYDAVKHRIWVACYSGSILVFEDQDTDSVHYPISELATNDTRIEECREGQFLTGSVPSTSAVAAKSALNNGGFTEVPATSYMVIAGSFRERSNAERHIQKLSTLGFDAFIHKTHKEHGLHQVVVGSFDSEQEAKRCYDRLLHSSIPAWIKRL